jgi:hypothetical protein
MEMTKNEVFGPYDHWSMVVLCDPKTGVIMHTHQAVTTRGGTHPDQATLEKAAAQHASRVRKIPADGMAFLAVNPHGIDLNARYTVDVRNRSLQKAAPRAPKAQNTSTRPRG